MAWFNGEIPGNGGGQREEEAGFPGRWLQRWDYNHTRMVFPFGEGRPGQAV